MAEMDTTPRPLHATMIVRRTWVQRGDGDVTAREDQDGGAGIATAIPDPPLDRSTASGPRGRA